MTQKTANTIAVLGVSAALVAGTIFVVSTEQMSNQSAYLVSQTGGQFSSTPIPPSSNSSAPISSQASSVSVSVAFSSLVASSVSSAPSSVSSSQSSFSTSFSQISFSSFSFSRSSQSSSEQSQSATSSEQGGGSIGGSDGGGDGGDFGGLIGIGGESGGGFIGGGGTFGGVATGGGGGVGAKKSGTRGLPENCISDTKKQTCIPLIQPLGPKSFVMIQPTIGTFISYFNDAVPLLMTVAVGFCVLWILIGSYFVMVSGSDGGKRSRGKEIITWAIIGLILVNFAGFFLRTLNNIFFV